MNQKPTTIYILVILWIIIGVLFIGRTISLIEYLGLYGLYISTVISIIVGIICIIFSFLLAYGTFIKKELFWLIGLMFSSFLFYFVLQGINSIGMILRFTNVIRIFYYVAPIFFIFLVPCQIFLLTRPEVKIYFGKKA
jgi:hypothetical protein